MWEANAGPSKKGQGRNCAEVNLGLTAASAFQLALGQDQCWRNGRLLEVALLLESLSRCDATKHLHSPRARAAPALASIPE